MGWIHEAFIQTKSRKDWSGAIANKRECKIALMNCRINGQRFRSVEAIMQGWGEE